MANKFEWSPQMVWITAGGIGSLLLILPNLGDGTDKLVRVLNTTNVAYAAKETAEQNKDEFHEYLTKQEAYTEALQGYVVQQQQSQQMMQQQMPMYPNAAYTPRMQAAPEPRRAAPDMRLREWDDQTQAFWCCASESRDECFKVNGWQRCQ